MWTDDYDILDNDGKDGTPANRNEPEGGPLIWPWLMVLGLLVIGVGVVGAMAS